jgi:hypothetical protein
VDIDFKSNKFFGAQEEEEFGDDKNWGRLSECFLIKFGSIWH